MRKSVGRIALASVAIMAATSVIAQDTPRLLCTVAASVGFNWENGRWVSKTFTPKNYLVSRVPVLDHIACDFWFLGREANGQPVTTEPEALTGGGTRRHGCWSLSEVGVPPIELWDYHVCLEYYSAAEPLIATLYALRCDFDEIRSSPAYSITVNNLGPMELVRTSTRISRSDDTRTSDSLFLEVGVCSVL